MEYNLTQRLQNAYNSVSKPAGKAITAILAAAMLYSGAAYAKPKFGKIEVKPYLSVNENGKQTAIEINADILQQGANPPIEFGAYDPVKKPAAKIELTTTGINIPKGRKFKLIINESYAGRPILISTRDGKNKKDRITQRFNVPALDVLYPPRVTDNSQINCPEGQDCTAKIEVISRVHKEYFASVKGPSQLIMVQSPMNPSSVTESGTVYSTSSILSRFELMSGTVPVESVPYVVLTKKVKKNPLADKTELNGNLKVVYGKLKKEENLAKAKPSSTYGFFSDVQPYAEVEAGYLIGPFNTGSKTKALDGTDDVVKRESSATLGKARIRDTELGLKKGRHNVFLPVVFAYENPSLTDKVNGENTGKTNVTATDVAGGLGYGLAIPAGNLEHIIRAAGLYRNFVQKVAMDYDNGNILIDKNKKASGIAVEVEYNIRNGATRIVDSEFIYKTGKGAIDQKVTIVPVSMTIPSKDDTYQRNEWTARMKVYLPANISLEGIVGNVTEKGAEEDVNYTHVGGEAEYRPVRSLGIMGGADAVVSGTSGSSKLNQFTAYGGANLYVDDAIKSVIDYFSRPRQKKSETSANEELDIDKIEKQSKDDIPEDGYDMSK